MAVTFEGCEDYQTNGTTFSFTSHSITASPNKFALIFISSEGDPTPVANSFTFGGRRCFQMTCEYNSSSRVFGNLYGCFVPKDWSGTYTVAGNMTASTNHHVIVATYNDVLTWRKLTLASYTGQTTTPSVDVTSVSGDLVIDFLTVDNDGAAWTPTAGAGQTRDLYDSARDGVAISHETATGTTTTMSWSQADTLYSVQIAVSLIPWSMPSRPFVSHSPQGNENVTGTSNTLNDVNLQHNASKGALIAWIAVHGASTCNAASATATIDGTGYPMTKVIDKEYAVSNYCYVALFILTDISNGEGTIAFSWTGTATDGCSGWLVVDNVDTGSARDSDSSSGYTSNAVTFPAIDSSSTDLSIMVYYGRSYIRDVSLSGAYPNNENSFYYAERHRDYWYDASGSTVTWTLGTATADTGYVAVAISLKAYVSASCGVILWNSMD